MNNIYTFFIPHSPLLISKVGQEHSQKLSASIRALKKIRDKIYKINPDKIIIITPPLQNFKNISINQSEKYLIDFKAFGNLSLEFEAPGDLDYSTQLKDFLRSKKFNINLFSEERVCSKSFVSFYYLNQYHIASKGFENELNHDPNIKNEFIVINASRADLNYHEEFGKMLVQFLADKKEKIVIIAMGNLLGPAKKKKDGDLFIADKIIDFIQKRNYSGIIKLKEQFKKDLDFGVRPLMMIAPLISKLDLKPQILSVDKEFGGVYLNIEFK